MRRFFFSRQRRRVNKISALQPREFFVGIETKDYNQLEMETDVKSFDASETEEILRGIQQRLATAWIEGDRAFIERVLADDWSVIDLTGRVLTKAEVLEEAFGSEDRRVVSMRIDDISVRVFGDWAIVRGRTRAAGEYRGEAAEVALRFTDVFVRRHGNWQAVASQATLISQ